MHRTLLTTLALLAAVAAHAQYSVVTVDAPGADRTIVLDINDSGTWAGYAVQSIPGAPGGGIYTAFTGTGSTLTPFSSPNPNIVGIGASGINASGGVSGVSVDSTFTAKGFYRSAGGSFSTIDPAVGGFTSAYSEAVDLNDHGVFVGFYTETVPMTEQETSENSHAFIYDNGVYSVLNHPGMGTHGTQLYSVNDSGTMSGRYLDGSGISHGFLYHKGTGTYDAISIPGFVATEGGGLNNHGDYTAVGYVPNPLSPDGVDVYGFLHTGAGYVPFALPGAVRTVPFGLNDQGQVVGYYVDATFAVHGFVATPVPEPASLAALGLGAAALLRRRRS